MIRRYFLPYSGLPKEVYYLFAAKLVNCMGMFIMPLLTLIMTQKLGMDTADAGGMAAFLILTQAPCLIIGGKLADTLGRKKTLVMGSLLGAFFYLACGLGLAGEHMIYFIILAADMSALTIPSSDALLADFTKPEERQGAYSLLYLGGNIGLAVSPILGGLMFQNYLPLLFLIDGATAAAGALVIIINVRERYVRPEKGVSPDESAPRQKSLLSALKAAPYIVVFALLMFIYDFCYTQWSFMLPAQFGERFSDYGAKLYSVLCSANAVTVIILTPLITSFTRRMRPLAAIAIGGLLYCAAYLGFGAEGPYALFFVSAEIFTLGEICSTIQIGAFISNSVPSDCLGRVNAFINFVRGAAVALGPMYMGRLLMNSDYRAGWLITAGIILFGSAGMFILGIRRKRAI